MNNLTSTVDFDEFHVNLIFDRSIHRSMHTHMGEKFEDWEKICSTAWEKLTLHCMLVTTCLGTRYIN